VDKRGFQRLGTYVSSTLTDFEYAEPLLYRRPVEHVLCRLHFEQTHARDTVAVTMAVQPLFVPRMHEELSFAQPLGGPWSVAKDSDAVAKKLATAIRRKGLPFFEKAGTPAGFLETFGLTHKTPAGPRVIEESAYALVLLGRPARAREALRRLVAERRDDPASCHVVARADTLLVALGRRPQAAKETLASWREYTLRALLPAEAAAAAAA